MTRKQKKALWRIIASVALLLVCEVVMRVFALPQLVRLLIYLVPYLVIGYDILIKAGKGILNRQVFDENFLMAIATVGAMVLGEYREGAAVMLFYQIGELFQSVAVGKSRRSIAALMDIRPDHANIEEDGEIVEVDPDDVEVGDIIIVKPGEKIPIDGVIAEGTTTLDTAALTGESLPVDASEGAEVKSGSINLSGLIKIRTTKEFGDSTVSKILELVENSAEKKSRSENFISKFARYYTPAVCISALILAFGAPLVQLISGTSPDWGSWVMRALIFLVISCPCALVISIPLTFFAAIGGASSSGILIKGSNYIETLANIRHVVFDKTGTITKGVFEVTEIDCAEDMRDTVLEYAALAESVSSHPIAKSIVSAYGKPIDKNRIASAEELSGHGVRVNADGRTILAGNEKLMKAEGISCGEVHHEGTHVYVALDGKYIGCIVISDVVKPYAAQAVSDLKKCGVKRVVMLTGDSEKAAAAAARAAGIDEYRASLLPEDKVAEVERLIAEKGAKEAVAFTGDGINDAPVISRADIGFAMGALGSDAAIEAADIVLMDDDPRKIAQAIRLARKCMRIVYENIVFAIGVKVICLILGALGIANMWLAIFADVGVMVIAVLNAVRMIRDQR